MTPEAKLNSFDAWAEGARPRLLRLVTPMLGQRAEAEDVVQETLLAVWKRRDQVEDWDAYAARACWLNALKRKGRRRDWMPLEDYEAGLGAKPGQVQAALPTDFEVEAWELEQAIERLPPAQQAVIRMRFYAGHSFQEIGQALQISLNTAASRARYALAALKAALSPGPEPGPLPIKKIKGGKRGKRKRT
jgi:RNA polymerase sigma-70 factor (ECF subfamily)